MTRCCAKLVYIKLYCKLKIGHITPIFLDISSSFTEHRWFSGRMLACHAGGPGSIPGRCKFFLLLISITIFLIYYVLFLFLIILNNIRITDFGYIFKTKILFTYNYCLIFLFTRKLINLHCIIIHCDAYNCICKKTLS